MTGKPSYLWAAEQVLREQGQPLRVEDIVALAQDGGLFSDEMNSRTPQKSMQARLSMEIVNNGDNSRFVRTAKGVFFLRELILEDADRSSSIGSLRLPKSEGLRTFRARPRGPKQTTENVLTIPSEACRETLEYQGIRELEEDVLLKLLKSKVQHIPRTTAEKTEDYKQVITYVLVTHKDQILCFRRGRFNRAAQFLRGSLCIGIGGHVTEMDYSLFSAEDLGTRDNAAREIEEEVKIEFLHPAIQRDLLQFRGLINDNSTALGRKHLGVVYQYEVPVDHWQYWKSVSKNEMSINELRWIDFSLGEINLIEYEYWSQLCLRMLSPKLLSAQADYRVFRKKPFRSPHILAVVGGIGSGKSSAAQALQDQYNYSIVNSGRVLAGLLGILPVPTTPRRLFQDAAWNFISKPDGPSLLADALYESSVRSGADRIIIDGIRQLATLGALRERAGGSLAVLFVHAAPDLALRLYCRREGHNEATFEAEFNRMIGAPVEADIHKMMNRADAVLYNWSGEENFGQAINSMASELSLKSKSSSGD